MAQVPATQNVYTGNGTNTVFTFTFPYLHANEIFVYVNGVVVTYTLTSPGVVQTTVAPPNGSQVVVSRSTAAYTPLYVFESGIPLRAAYIDANNRQLLYVAQEVTNASTAAGTIANQALTTANQALTNSNTAIGTANNALSAANNAVATANAASTAAGNAVTTANAASAKADTAISTANGAVTTANAASTAAGNAVNTANNALTVANGVDAKATTALANSNAAVADAAEALATANAIDGKAQTALDNSAAAVNTANDAITIAQGIDNKAQQALDASAAAVTTANNASSVANAVDAKAQQALDNSVAAVNTANAASNTANTLKTDLAANSNTAAKGSKLVGYGVWASSFRTVHDKLRETVSVLDYGADPTGAASSLAAFNAAFSNNLNVNIYVPPGTYAGVGGSTLTGGLANTWIIARGVSFPAATKINGETDLNWLPGKVFSQIGNTGTTGSGWKIGHGGLWMESTRPASQAIAEMTVSSAQGNYGIIGASRTSLNPTPNAQSTIGVGAIVNNDNTAQTKPAWGLYVDVSRQANTGPGFGMEIDSRNYGNTFALDPYNVFDFTPANSPVVNLWMSTGGGDGPGTPQNSSAAMCMLPNPKQFNVGIVARNGSISSGQVLTMPSGYTINWYSGAGITLNSITDKKYVISAGGDGNVGGVDYYQVYAQRSMAGFSHLTGGQVLYEIVAQGYAGLGSGYQLGGIARWIKDGPYTTNNRTYFEVYTGGNGGTGSLQAYTMSPLYFATADNTAQLGLGSNRWTQVWAVNGTIQTSDERQKQDIESIPDVVLDAWAGVEWLQYRWKVDVAEKGAGARMHSGVIAQRVQKAFEDVGLSAFEYGLLCLDQWDEQQEVWEDHEATLPDGTKEVKRTLTKPYRAAGDLLSVRYEEALAMEAALMRRTRDRLEARLNALEALNK